MEKKSFYPPFILHVGDEKTTSIRELVETIVKVSNRKIEIRYNESKPVRPLSRIPYIKIAVKGLRGLRMQVAKWASTNVQMDGTDIVGGFA
jgi:nucleoside-diphosphate-sugar epimerase